MEQTKTKQEPKKRLGIVPPSTYRGGELLFYLGTPLEQPAGLAGCETRDQTSIICFYRRNSNLKIVVMNALSGEIVSEGDLVNTRSRRALSMGAQDENF